MVSQDAGQSAGANPLLDALPPATDYLTYLTIIEYNLTPDRLPTLHEVLKDVKLTTNIGWDLVHLLLPLLPASQECLQDIARFGNPREVILKVTECLRLIDFVGSDSDSHAEAEDLLGDGHSHAHPHATEPVHSHSQEATQAIEVIPTPLPVDQFISLLSMLSILHGRIQTKHPSRFLSTSLQAILHAFSTSTSHREELVSSVVRFVKEVSGVKRPHLPSRASSNSSTLLLNTSSDLPPDPESETASGKPSADDVEIQSRLIQSFLTFIVEDYLLGLRSRQDAPGLSWATRLQEKLHPERVIPGRSSMTKLYESQPPLHARQTAVGQLVATARDLGIKIETLMDAALAQEHPSSSTDRNEEEHPKSAADVPLSKTGSFLLYTASTIGKALFSEGASTPAITIFPAHQQLLAELVTSPASGASMTGTEPEAVLDALLALAIQAIEADNVGQPTDAEQFNNYLQVVSLIASNCPSPSLRYIAYYVTTTILRSNPSDMERLGFIRDTLEHCPFDNLRVAAISWIKGETIEACGSHERPNVTSSSAPSTPATAISGEHSIFATPIAIDNLSPYLFPAVRADFDDSDCEKTFEVWDQNLQFYLASLNLYFLLLSSQNLREALGIKVLRKNHKIDESFVKPLSEVTQRLRSEGGADGVLGKRWAAESDSNIEEAKLKLMEATLEKVTEAAARADSV